MKFLKKLVVLLFITQSLCSKCRDYYDSEVTIRISAKDSIPNSVLWVTCSHNSTKFDLSNLPNCSFPLVTIVRFDYCVLNNNLAESLALLGVDADQVKEIVLSAPKIKQLDSKLLQGFLNVISFIVYNGNISSISEGAFLGVPNLERLILNDNLFETLPPSVFRKLTELKILILNRQIQTLHENLFSRNFNLEILHLYSNKLRNLPSNIFRGLTSMQKLSLSSNHLTSIDETIFRDCRSLKSLNLKKNHIKIVSESMFTNCTELESIDVSHNRIEQISDKIFLFNENLKNIVFSSNSLNALPEKLISHLNKLENISFSENNLKSIPESLIQNNGELISIELRGNDIEVLPSQIFINSHNLKIIDLGNNNLTSLPDNFFKECLSLEILLLDKNNLKSLLLNQFPPVGSYLKEINLSRNQLKLASLYQFGSFVLANQISLYHIDLSHNNIEQMPYALYTLSQLKYLNLENNSITFFSFEFLREIISSIMTLNVRNNSIKTISANIMFPLEITAEISISGNPINCDCKMFDFAEFLRGNKRFVKNIVFTDINNLFCSNPGIMNGQLVKTVDSNKFTCQIPATNVSKCSTMCDCVIQPSAQTVFVNCSHKKLLEVPPLAETMRRTRFPLSVDLSSNYLVSFNFTHPSFSSLTNLSLANNSLNDASLNKLLPELSNKLKFLNLSGNNFTYLEENFVAFIENKSMKIDLSGRNWKCDCSLKPLHKFLQTKYFQVYNIRELFCSGYAKPLIDLTTEDICYGKIKLTAIIVMPLLAIIMAVLVTVTFFKYQISLRVWLYSKRATRWLVTEKYLDADKEYDAFISYSHEDENFINETLVPGLENGNPNYKVCLHYRDWTPGELIQTQILESVANSRRTIVILSKNFIKSVWGKMEFRVAHQRALKDNTNRVIVIVYGEMPPFKTLDDELKHYVNTRTYLNYDNDRFWDHLRYAMPHKADGIKMKQFKLQKVAAT